MKTLWIEDAFCYVINHLGEKSSLFSISFPRKSE
jgi:hypothetical protein